MVIAPPRERTLARTGISAKPPRRLSSPAVGSRRRHKCRSVKMSEPASWDASQECWNGVVPVRVSVQASPRDRTSWLTLATKVERLGFDGLYVSDHPGSGAAPFVALAAAAAVTERIQLGTCVLNAGVWDPLSLASTVATLDVVSGGRAVLGVGAGHTPQEWTMVGRPYPSPGARVDRMIELINATQALLRGAPVSHRGTNFTLANAVLADPRPVRDPIPLMVGGNGTRVLQFAAQHADVVGVTGTGRTLADGHRHEVDWSPAGLRRIVDIIRSAVDAARSGPQARGPGPTRRGHRRRVSRRSSTDRTRPWSLHR